MRHDAGIARDSVRNWCLQFCKALHASLLAILVLGSIAGPARAAEPGDAAVIEDLVYANRILVAHGILDTFGHISARSPAHPDHFLMARSRAPNLVTAKDILEFDMNGEPVVPTKERLYSERFIHAATYRARADVQSVLHSHSPEVLPFSVSKVPLRAIIHDAAFLGLRVSVFEGDSDGSNGTLLITNMTVAQHMAQSLGDDAVVLIRGHGDVVVGSSVADTVTRAVFVDKNARALKEAIMMGGPITYLTPVEIAARAKLMATYKEGRDWFAYKAEVEPIEP